jgi:hypothetical protein
MVTAVASHMRKAAVSFGGRGNACTCQCYRAVLVKANPCWLVLWPSH